MISGSEPDHDAFCDCEDCVYANGGEICATCGSLNCSHGSLSTSLEATRTTITLNGSRYEVTCTCAACPEQYDVKLGGVTVGYLRLRHGYFTVESTDCEGRELLCCQPNGDGQFDDEERARYIHRAIHAIDAALSRVASGLIELDEATRPETKAEEDAYFSAAFRGALERIVRALRIPGSPDLIDSVPAEVERRLSTGLDIWNRDLSHYVANSDPSSWELALRNGLGEKEAVELLLTAAALRRLDVDPVRILRQGAQCEPGLHVDLAAEVEQLRAGWSGRG